MKNFAQPSFFRVFDLLLGITNPGLKRSSWTLDGVAWERERHSFTGPRHGLAVEIVTLTRPDNRGWGLMVVKEYWWVGTESRALKSLRWAKPVAGQRSEIINWFRRQETALERQMVDSGHPVAPADESITEELECRSQRNHRADVR
jgi:hypothetical protein